MRRFITYLLNPATIHLTEESRFTCITIPKQEKHLKKKEFFFDNYLLNPNIQKKKKKSNHTYEHLVPAS